MPPEHAPLATSDPAVGPPVTRGDGACPGRHGRGSDRDQGVIFDDRRSPDRTGGKIPLLEAEYVTVTRLPGLPPTISPPASAMGPDGGVFDD